MSTRTALCRALSDRKLASSILELFDKYPSSVEQPNDDGSYPLHLACRHNCYKDGGRYDTVIRKLIEVYPKALQYKDKSGSTPLHVAIDWSCTTEIVCELIEQYTPAIRELDNDGNYPLHLACGLSRLCHEVVDPLVDAFPLALQQRNKKGQYPLLIAINNQSIEVILKMIELFPIAIEQNDNDGYYPLHKACQREWSEAFILKLLENFHFAATQRTVEKKLFPLHLACDYQRSIVVVRQLVKLYPQALKEMDYMGWYPKLTLVKYGAPGQKWSNTSLILTGHC
jgi:ankyrin repeat protein